jgi:hypothetical protein
MFRIVITLAEFLYAEQKFILIVLRYCGHNM